MKEGHMPENKFNIGAKDIPLGLVGCWHLISGVAAVPYLRIQEGGGYSVAGGITPFAVSANGAELDWNGTVYARHLGSGQTIFGVWRGGAAPDTEEYYFRDDGGVQYHDITSDLVGTADLLGSPFSGGNLIYWEKRANIIVSGNTVTAYTAYGGTFLFYYYLNGANLVIESEIGNLFEYKPVDCKTLT